MAAVQYEALRALREQGKLIPFIGAGLSMNLGLPSFSDLIKTIAGELGYDPEVYKLNGNNLQLAEYYVATKGSIGPLRSIMDESSTLFEVQQRMNANTICQDVFVTASGTNTEPIKGWVTNAIVTEKAKV